MRKAVRATVIAAQDADRACWRCANDAPPTARRSSPVRARRSVVWHTQGSGKSITMACYAGKLLQQPEMKNRPTLVVVTDATTWTGNCLPLLARPAICCGPRRCRPPGATSYGNMLASREAGGIIFTTVRNLRCWTTRTLTRCPCQTGRTSW
ncbi:MAG: hypothetical protein R3E42_14835 [Burkholderiaceae bacterium]